MTFHVSLLVLLITLYINLLCKMPLFNPHFSEIIVISQEMKFDFLFLSPLLFPLCSFKPMFTQIHKNSILPCFRSTLTQRNNCTKHLNSNKTSRQVTMPFPATFFLDYKIYPCNNYSKDK